MSAAPIKMKDNETGEKTFQSKCADKCVKFLGTYICPRFHTRGYCWKEGCKFSKTHLPASEIPEEQGTEYKQYMACCRATPSLNKEGIGSGLSSAQPRPPKKKPSYILPPPLPATAYIWNATEQEKLSIRPTITMENAPQDMGVIVVWKDGLV